MPTEFITGDLFSYPDLEALGHGCNCAGAMGKGIALEFKRRYPTMYSKYRSLCKAENFNLGDVFFWEKDDEKVFNLGTQQTWKTGAKLKAIETAVTRMLEIATEAGISKIGIPRIGAGLGGLKWEDVRAVLERIGNKSEITLVIFEKFEKSQA